MAQWYAYTGDRQYGPVSDQHLARWLHEGRIGPDDYVWREGMTHWARPQEVPELSDCMARAAAAGARQGPWPPDSALARSTGPAQSPSVPGVLWVGVGIYAVLFLIGCGIGFAEGAAGHDPGVDMELACVIGVLTMVLLAADVVGMVMACLGRAWGAVLYTVAMAIWFLVSLALYAAETIEFTPVELLVWMLSIASVVCFMTPTAWSYYRASEAFRHGRIGSPGS